MRLLGREVELAMTLREFVPNERVVYQSVQAGLPDAHHERHFSSVEGGFTYRILVAYEPRRGLRGVLTGPSSAAASTARCRKRW